MKRTYQRFIIALLVLIAGWLVFQFPQPSATTVSIAEATVTVEVADTLSELQQGLSGRASLGENEGMLFVFEEPDTYTFWMKDMNFPLDIIWIDENKVIAGITENVSPDSFPETFASPEPVRYVLEVNAGWVARNDIQVGDEVDLGR